MPVILRLCDIRGMVDAFVFRLVPTLWRWNEKIKKQEPPETREQRLQKYKLLWRRQA